MTVRLITPPAAEPVTLEMARLHTRAEAVEDDALLTVLITAARQQGEGVTRRVFGESVWEVETGPLTAPLRLPLVPCMAVESVTVGGEAVDTGLYGFTPSGLLPQESPLRAAFIPGPDAQSTFCLRYETYLLYSAVVRFKLTVIDKSGFGHTAFKPALQSPGVGFGQVVAGIHGNDRTLRLNSGFQIRGNKNFKKGGRFRVNHHDWRI